MKIASQSCQNRENHIKIVKICDTRLIMKVTAEIKDMCKPLDLPGGLAAVEEKCFSSTEKSPARTILDENLRIGVDFGA